MNSGTNANPSRAVCLVALDELHLSITIFHNAAVSQGMQLVARQRKVKEGVGFSQVQKSKPTKGDTVLGCPLASAHECNMEV